MAVSQVRVASRVWIYPVISLQMTLMFCETPSEQLGHPNGLCSNLIDLFDILGCKVGSLPMRL